MAISTQSVIPGGAAGRRLLVVDDHASIRELLANWAQDRGYEARLAADGHEALTALEHQAFDLVISDMRMPGLSGLDLLQRLPDTNRRAAIVFITAFGSVQEAVQALHAGALDYVTKPFNVEDLFRRIEARLASQPAASLGPAPMAPSASPVPASAAVSIPTSTVAPGGTVSNNTPTRVDRRSWGKLG